MRRGFSSLEQRCHQRLLGVEAVFRFVPDHGAGTVEDFGGDFLAAVGGEAVHDDGGLVGVGEELGVELEGAEGLKTIGSFGFEAHRYPGVGVDDVAVLDRGDGVVGDDDFGGVDPARQLREVGLVALGSAEAEFEAAELRGEDPGVAHVAGGVAEEADAQALEVAELLDHGLQVGEELAGVEAVGEGVDDGDRAFLAEGGDLVVGVAADDDAVQVAGEDAGGVFIGLAAAELEAVAVEVEGGAAEFVDADLEGDAGAGRGLQEDQAD